MDDLDLLLSGESELRVLNLESSISDSTKIQDLLTKKWGKLAFLRVEGTEAFVHALDHFKPVIIISNYSVPHFDGAGALHSVRSNSQY